MANRTHIVGAAPLRLVATAAVLAAGFGLRTTVADPPPASAPASGPPVAAPAPTRPYDESADAKAQIAAALAAAKLDNRRVLVQWGGNWCPWCIRLHGLMATDKEIAKTLQSEYEVVLVDAGRPAGKNVELAKSYGAGVDTRGFPFLTVLDADGRVVANQDTEALERRNPDGTSAGLDAGHDPAAVLAFLTKHKPAPQVAWAVYDDALRRARESDRRILVRFGAPWCPWCHRFADWLRSPEVAPRIQKDFVDVAIDVDRMTGGRELLAKLNPAAAKTGLPWFALLDRDGALIVTSTMTRAAGADGGTNTGFPATPEEIDHFASMLRTAARRMSAADRESLVESLRAARRASDAAAAPSAPGNADAPRPALTEEQRIDRLIAHVEGLQGARFIRNGAEYDAKDAAAHLRRKLSAQRSSVRTVDDFIRLCATGSSLSGDAYRIRLADGADVACAEYLRRRAEAPNQP